MQADNEMKLIYDCYDQDDDSHQIISFQRKIGDTLNLIEDLAGRYIQTEEITEAPLTYEMLESILGFLVNTANWEVK